MTGLSLYKLLFVFELLVIEGLLIHRLKRRKFFALRAAFAVAVCFLAAVLYPVGENTYSGLYASLMFLVLFSVTCGAMLFVCKISFKNAAFCAIAAYSAQHLAYEIFKLILTPFDIFVAQNMYGNGMVHFGDIDGIALAVMLAYVDIYFVVYAAAYFFIGKKIRGDAIRIKNMSLLILSGVILLIDVVLNAFIVYIDAGYNKTYDIMAGIYNALCCMLVFYIQRSIIDAGDMKNELETVAHLLQQAKKQYQIKKEEIDLINIKCHDLKYQVGKYVRGGGLDGAAVSEIENMISIYDATIKTGNEVLDIILTEKSLICQSKNIKLTCMVDRADLGFISDGELFVLFGNMFDNAMEAASHVSDPEKCCINLNIHREGGFISVMMENYYADDIYFDERGMPVTKKSDKNYHGFGLKSIRIVVEKYDGDLSLSAEDGLFRLNILLPLPPKGAAAGQEGARSDR